MIKNLRYLLLMVLMLAGGAIFAQSSVGEIDGKVTDGTGEAIIGAVVHAEQGGIQKNGGVTDYDGKFAIKGLTPGRYDLIVQYPGMSRVKITGITIAPSGGITYQNVKMVDNNELETVVIKYEKPLVDAGKPGTNRIMTSDEIEQLPTRNTADFAALSTQVVQRKSGGSLNIGGARSDGTLYVIDGVMVSGGTNVNLPANAIDQLEVMMSGIPAKYGDATGGVINIVTKSMSSTLKGSGLVEHSVEGFNNNRATLSLSGPFLSRTVNGIKKPIVGFFVTGEYQYNKDNDPSYGGNYVVKDEVRENLQQNPIVASPSDNGSITYKPATEYLTAQDFVIKKARVNAAGQAANFLGKLNYEIVPGTTLTGGLSVNYNKGTSYSRSLSYVNPDAMRETMNYTGRGYLRFSQRLGNSDNDSGSAIQNAFYSVQADYQRDYAESAHPEHGRNTFDYGYVGKFTEHLSPIYTVGVDPGINRVGVILAGYQYSSPVSYERSDVNPLLANYTSGFYNLGGIGPSNMSNNPLSGIYLRNGDAPNNVYSLFSNVGSYVGSYNYQRADQISFNIDASFDYKTPQVTHSVEFGLYYQQRSERYYGMNASNLWSLMRLLTHRVINSSDLDSSSAIYIVGGQQYTREQIQNGEAVFGPTDTVKYLSLYNAEAAPEGGFDYNLRTKLGLDPRGTDYLQPDAYDPSLYSVGMFTADELLLSYTNPLVTYYGYDYTGKTVGGQVNFNDFWTAKDQYGNFTRPIGAYRPSYLAGYISDRIKFKQILFTLGLRVERFDNNTKIFRDPYSLYAVRTTQSVDGAQNFLNGGAHPANIGDDYVVYVNSNSGTSPGIIGYRDGDTWYDPYGREVEDPTELKQYTSTDPQPYLQVPDGSTSVPSITEAGFNPDQSFKDYKPLINVLPRISFSFPINDKSIFYAHYDVIAQRPRVGLGYTGLNGGLTGVGAYVSPMDYVGLVTSPGSLINNADLQMPKLTDYEVGFQQEISRNSAITINAFYKERKNEIQLRPYTYAYPYTYYTYRNVDNSTTSGIGLQYDLRRTNHIALTLGYTLQYARGTGSSSTSGNGGSVNSVAANGLLSYLVSANVPNLKFYTPLDYDSRHIINVNADYRFMTGEGPVVAGKHILENAGLNLLFTTRSGEPYTKLANPQTLESGVHNANTILGLINTSRIGWHYMVNLKVDKSFKLDFSKKAEDGSVKGKVYNMQAYVYVQNLLNYKDVIDVYRYTGDVDNDGFLTSPQGTTRAATQTNAQSYYDLYYIYMQNPGYINNPRRIYVGLNFSF